MLGGRVKRGVVVFFVSTTEVRTTRLFYIYGSWVRIREFGGVTTSVNNFGKMRRPPQPSLPLLFAEEDQLQPDQVPGEEKLV